MSAAGRADAGTDADPAAVAAAIEEAGLVQLVAISDGDGLAAAGLLARACAERGVPYHVRAARTDREIEDHVTSADVEATSIVLGAHNPMGPAIDGRAPTAPMAYAVARHLDANRDPVLALAGAVAAGAAPDTGSTARAFDDATGRGVARRPGVAIPVPDPADGLAHSTLIHGTFSGDPEVTRGALSGLDWPAEPTDDDRRTLASWIALEATDGDTSTRAAGALGRALHPFVPGGPFATLGGYADVLSALAERSPGLAVALAVGTDSREDALAVWREHGRAAHAAVRDAETARYGGFLVAHVASEPVRTVARLIRDFRSPEPTVLAVGDEAAAVAADEPNAGTILSVAADAVGGTTANRGRTGYASFDEHTDATAIVTAFQEAR